jgi:RimJ/RimL family protein N-acetyltransferase
MEIETERLILRPVRPGDIDDLLAMHEDPRVREFFGEYDRAKVTDWVVSGEAEWAERGTGKVVVLDRESGAFLGRTGLRYWPQFDETEVGWVLTAAARGRGIATEAARACVDWGFRDLDVPYLTAMIHPTNAGSIAVAERLGMAPLREDVLHGEEIVVYAVSR